MGKSTKHPFSNEPSRTSRPGVPRRMHWIARLLGRGEDPLTWSVPLFRVHGVQLRMHMIFIVWAAAELLISARPDVPGPLHKASLVCGLVVVLLAREVARIVISRRGGWLPGRMVLWQGGALSSPLGLMPRLKAPLAGLAASLLMVAIAVGALIWAGAPLESLWFNILEPGILAGTIKSELQVVLWWTYYGSVLMLLLNLVPMPPLDAGRVMQCLLTKSMGQRGALKGAAQFGLMVAVTLLVVGVVAEQMRLVALAAVGGLVCWIELRRLAFIEDAAVERALDITDWIEGIAVAEHVDDEQVLTSMSTEPIANHGPSIDELLSKVRSHGLGSLTEQEQATLRSETEQLRGKNPRR